MNCPMAIIDKRRPYHNKAEVVHVIGNVKGKNCVLLDDMIDTAGTITAAANALMKNQATSVIICATHGVLSNNASEKLNKCKAQEVVITDSLPIPDKKRIGKMTIISISGLMAQVIQRIHDHRSLGELFSWEEKVNVSAKREE